VLTFIALHKENPHRYQLVLQKQYRNGCWIHSVQNLLGVVEYFGERSLEYKIIIPLLGCRLIETSEDRSDYDCAYMSEEDVEEHSKETSKYTTYLVQVNKGGLTGFATMRNFCTGTLLLNGIADLDLSLLLNALNDPKTGKGIYLGKRKLHGSVQTMVALGEALKKGCRTANAAILYYGYRSAEATFGHYVSIWYYDGQGKGVTSNWCFYDSFDKKAYFAKQLAQLDNKLLEGNRIPLKSANKYIHAFALPTFKSGQRNSAIAAAIKNVKNTVQESLSFYQLKPLIDLAMSATAMQGNKNLHILG
jgi:hypothetical protein